MTANKQEILTHTPSHGTYAHRQADHHRRMLSLLSIGSTLPAEQPVQAIKSTTPSPISPTGDNNLDSATTARSSSISSGVSILQSPLLDSDAETFMNHLYGASKEAQHVYPNPHEYGQQYNEGYQQALPSYVNNPVYVPKANPTDAQYRNNNNSAYGQLIDNSPSAGYSDVTRPMYNIQESIPLSHQPFSPGWNLSYGVSSSALGHKGSKQAGVNPQLASSYETMGNPYGYNPNLAYGFAGSSSSSSSITSPNTSSTFNGINPGCLNGHLNPNHDMVDGHVNEVDTSMECPPSPLQSISDSASPIPLHSDFEPRAKRPRTRRASESMLGTPEESGKRSQKRKHTWTPGMAAEGPNVSEEQKLQELQDLDRLMAGGPAFRRERRRLQNRLAQRAFRARSKVTNKETANHMGDLEHLAEIQAEKLAEMSIVLAKLQRENSVLKTTGQPSNR